MLISQGTPEKSRAEQNSAVRGWLNCQAIYTHQDIIELSSTRNALTYEQDSPS